MDSSNKLSATERSLTSQLEIAGIGVFVVAFAAYVLLLAISQFYSFQKVNDVASTTIDEQFLNEVHISCGVSFFTAAIGVASSKRLFHSKYRIAYAGSFTIAFTAGISEMVAYMNRSLVVLIDCYG